MVAAAAKPRVQQSAPAICAAAILGGHRTGIGGGGGGAHSQAVSMPTVALPSIAVPALIHGMTPTFGSDLARTSDLKIHPANIPVHSVNKKK